MASSSTDFIRTTKFQWSNFEPYTLPTRGEQNVPEQYLKNAKWGYSPYTGTEGYHANSHYDEETYFCYIMAGMFTRRESGDRSARTKQEGKGSECKLRRVT